MPGPPTSCGTVIETVAMYNPAGHRHELHNLAEDPAHAAARDALLAGADAW